MSSSEWLADAAAGTTWSLAAEEKWSCSQDRPIKTPCGVTRGGVRAGRNGWGRGEGASRT